MAYYSMSVRFRQSVSPVGIQGYSEPPVFGGRSVVQPFISVMYDFLVTAFIDLSFYGALYEYSTHRIAWAKKIDNIPYNVPFFTLTEYEIFRAGNPEYYY